MLNGGGKSPMQLLMSVAQAVARGESESVAREIGWVSVMVQWG
jgi:hypothetical protein